MLVLVVRDRRSLALIDRMRRLSSSVAFASGKESETHESVAIAVYMFDWL